MEATTPPRQNGESRAAESPLPKVGERVQIYARVRPASTEERVMGAAPVVSVAPLAVFLPPVGGVSPPSRDQGSPSHREPREYRFDGVLGPEANQAAAYAILGAPLVDEVRRGRDASLLAYGQTGGGKSYTLLGGQPLGEDALPKADEPEGVIPRLCRDLFRPDPHHAVSVRMSFVQVYNERVYDLLSSDAEGEASPGRPRAAWGSPGARVGGDPWPRGAQLRLRAASDADSQSPVDGARVVPVATADELLDLFSQGLARIMRAETLMNRHSSRAHAVVRLVVHTRDRLVARPGPSCGAPSAEESALRARVRAGTLTIVDLAGSERSHKSGVLEPGSEPRLREASFINRSLLTLGVVVRALARGGKDDAFVPYRSSKLTTLLRNAIGGACATKLVVCVSPSAGDELETAASLAWAQIAARVKSAPPVHQWEQVLPPSMVAADAAAANEAKALLQRGTASSQLELGRPASVQVRNGVRGAATPSNLARLVAQLNDELQAADDPGASAEPNLGTPETPHGTGGRRSPSSADRASVLLQSAITEERRRRHDGEEAIRRRAERLEEELRQERRHRADAERQADRAVAAIQEKKGLENQLRAEARRRVDLEKVAADAGELSDRARRLEAELREERRLRADAEHDAAAAAKATEEELQRERARRKEAEDSAAQAVDSAERARGVQQQLHRERERRVDAEDVAAEAVAAAERSEVALREGDGALEAFRRRVAGLEEALEHERARRARAEEAVEEAEERMELAEGLRQALSNERKRRTAAETEAKEAVSRANALDQALREARQTRSEAAEQMEVATGLRRALDGARQRLAAAEAAAAKAEEEANILRQALGQERRERQALARTPLVGAPERTSAPEWNSRLAELEAATEAARQKASRLEAALRGERLAKERVQAKVDWLEEERARLLPAARGDEVARETSAAAAVPSPRAARGLWLGTETPTTRRGSWDPSKEGAPETRASKGALPVAVQRVRTELARLRLAQRSLRADVVRFGLTLELWRQGEVAACVNLVARGLPGTGPGPRRHEGRAVLAPGASAPTS